MSVPPPGSKPPTDPTPHTPEIHLEFEDTAASPVDAAQSAVNEVAADAARGAPQRSLRINTLIVMAGTLGSRLSGIVRQQIINLFDTALTDAFNVAIKVPNLMRELLAEGALVNSFIPVYKTLDEAGRRQLAQAFSGVMIAVNLLLMALGILAAPWVVDFLTAANANVNYDLTVYMTRLVMPFLMLISLSAVAMGLLNADEHFKESSFAPIAFNLASIAALLLLPDTATWLGIGWLIGGVAQLLVQLPALNRFGLLPTPALKRHPALGRVLRQMAPFTLTAGARQFLNIYVTRLLTNTAQFPSGTQTGYANAEALFTMVNGLFVVSPVLALFPRFSQRAAEGNWAAFRALTAQAIRTTTFLAAPMSALMVALAPYAVSIINLQRLATQDDLNKFNAGASILTGWALALVPWALVTVLLRTFYARERTREAVTVSAAGFVLEVILYRLLVPPLGFLGFGISTTISGLLMAGALTVMYRRALGFPTREVATHLTRVLPLAAAAGLVAWGLSRLMPAPGTLIPGLTGLILGGGAGLAAYLLGALAFRLPEVAGVLKRLKR